MEIVIAAVFCIWLTFFAVWSYVVIKKDYRDQIQPDDKPIKKRK